MTEKNRIVYETLMKVSNFTKGVAKVQAGFKKLANLATGFATGFMGIQLFNMFKEWADEAGKLEIVNRSFARSFGSLDKEVGESLTKIGFSIGRNVKDLKQGAVAFNSFFKGLGFAAKESAELSVKLQELSLDLASFFGMSDQASQKRFIAALAGSPEVLDQFGINLKQAALQLELTDRGIKSSVQTTSELEKTHARLAIIMRAMTSSGIIGDAEEGVNTYAGKMKKLNAVFTQVKETVGQFVIPIFIQLGEAFIQTIELIKLALTPFTELNKLLMSFATPTDDRINQMIEKTIVNTEELNELIKLGYVAKSANAALDEEEYKRYLKIGSLLRNINKQLADETINARERNKLLRDKTLLRTQFLELGQKILEFDRVEKGLIEQTKKFLEERKELLEKEFEVIKEKYKKIKEINSFEGKSIDILTIERGLHIENLKIYKKQLEACILTSDEYDYQLLKLEEINLALESAIELQQADSKKKALQEELDVIETKYEKIREIKDFNETDRETLKLLSKEQSENLKIYKKQLEACIITTDEYKHQEDLLKTINKALLKSKGIQKEIHEVAPIIGRKQLFEREFDIGTMSFKATDNATKLADALFNVGDFVKKMEEKIQNFIIPAIEKFKTRFVETMSIPWETIIQPFANAFRQAFEVMLTPPDPTISKEEQAEKTKSAFAGIQVGLGQAMMAIGQGMIITAMGIKTLTTHPITGAAIGAAMIGTGALLVKNGKGKLQNIKNAQHARNGGGTANSGSGVGGFGSMMAAIQGEQVFRLAGNDLVTAINRTNTFQGSIGG